MTGKIKQAAILAGGLGTRLKPFTDNLPKPMVSVNNKPFMEYLVDMLRKNGIEEIVPLLGYLPEKIIDYFGDGSKFGVRMNYSVGDVSFETGKRIKHAQSILDDNFLLIYGDNYWPMNLDKMVNFYNNLGVDASVTIYNNRFGLAEYGPENNVHVSEDGHILNYDRTRTSPNLNGVDMGFFLLNRNILDSMPDSNFSFEKEMFPRLIDSKQLGGFRTDHRYFFITTPETLKITERFLDPKKVVFLDRDGVINKNAPEYDYVKSWDEFEFLPGSIEAIRKLNKNKFQVYLFTNQQGVNRGIISMGDVNNIHQNMIQELSAENARINGIYVCPHRRDENCFCRKPQPGMLYQASNEHLVDLTKSIVIGDKETDIEAGKIVGAKTFLVSEKKSLLDIVNEII
ncbi:MAG: HAD-IIIA family hydrolase [archaeon]|nr:HAD-IIIA family hydrolase [archaeon]